MSFDQERLAALQGKFVASLAGKADDLAELIQDGDLAGARALAHSLAGRAGMFGFAALGETALSVDEASEDDLGARAQDLLSALRIAAQEA